MIARNSGNRSRLGDDEMRRLRDDGMSLQAIAALAGVSRQAVWDRLRKRTRKSSPGSPEPDPAELRAMGPEAPLWSYQPILSTSAFHTLFLLLGRKRTDAERDPSDARLRGEDLS
jgi:hypothetical protein